MLVFDHIDELTLKVSKENHAGDFSRQCRRQIDEEVLEKLGPLGKRQMSSLTGAERSAVATLEKRVLQMATAPKDAKERLEEALEDDAKMETLLADIEAGKKIEKAQSQSDKARAHALAADAWHEKALVEGGVNKLDIRKDACGRLDWDKTRAAVRARVAASTK